MEPVRKMCDETRRVGQALIQSAAAGVSTADIEFNLQSLNTAWTTLTDRVQYDTVFTYLTLSLSVWPSHSTTTTTTTHVSTLWIPFKQSVLVYKCLHGSAPAYLTDELCQEADVEARQRLCSSSSSSLIVSRTRLLTVSDRAFPVAAARVWNSLPDLVTSAPSVAVFRSRLKTHLFNISYPCACTVPEQ